MRKKLALIRKVAESREAIAVAGKYANHLLSPRVADVLLEVMGDLEDSALLHDADWDSLIDLAHWSEAAKG